MFRTIDMALREKSEAGRLAAEAVRTLIRDLTRQYESLTWTNEPPQIWMYNAYLRFTHMIQSRKLLIGFNSEQAFLAEAKSRCAAHHHHGHNDHKHSSLKNPIIHNSCKHIDLDNSNKHSYNTKKPTSYHSHWFICPCCAIANDHFSPSCPSQANGPSPIPKYIQDTTINAINAAPISQTAKTNLLRMASALYAKLDKKK